MSKKMNIIITILSLLFLSLVGFVVIKGFDLLPKKSNFFIFSLGYGLGVGLITAQMYFYSRIGLLWNTANLLLPWIVIGGVVYFLNKKRFVFKNTKYKRIDKFSVVLLFGIGFSVFYTIFEALIRPLAVWDGWAAWMIKSKAFFLDNTITISALTYIASDGPLAVSLLGSFVYLMLGQIDDTAVLLSSSAFYVFLIMLFYTAVREKQSPRYALFFTFLLAVTQTLIRQGGRLEAGQADLPLGYYFFSCTLLFLEYVKKGEARVLILLSIFLGVTSLVKFEGLPFTFMIGIFITYQIYRKKHFRQLPLLLFWLIPVFDWQNYKHYTNLQNIYASGHGIIFSLQKISNSVSGTLRELINIKSWNLLWITYFYCLFFLFRFKNKDLTFLHIIVISQLMLYILVYFFTIGNAPESSIPRLLVHIAPVALLAISIVTAAKSLK